MNPGGPQRGRPATCNQFHVEEQIVILAKDDFSVMFPFWGAVEDSSVSPPTKTMGGLSGTNTQQHNTHTQHTTHTQHHTTPHHTSTPPHHTQQIKLGLAKVGHDPDLRQQLHKGPGFLIPPASNLLGPKPPSVLDCLDAQARSVWSPSSTIENHGVSV